MSRLFDAKRINSYGRVACSRMKSEASVVMSAASVVQKTNLRYIQ